MISDRCEDFLVGPKNRRFLSHALTLGVMDLSDEEE